MPMFEVTFESGKVIEVQRADYHPGVATLIAHAKQANMFAGDEVRKIERIVEHSAGVQREIVFSAATTVELPADPPERLQKRLFVSFSYEVTTQTTAGSQVAFGNTIVDIEFEPYEGAHIAGLQRDITEYLKQHGEPVLAGSVTILGWQRISR